MRNAADSVALLERVTARPYAFDFFYVLRRLEATHPHRPRLGVAARPADEPIRLGQEPLLDFAPAALSGVRPARDARPPVIEVRFLGLLGPNGPLPLHLTEYARDRMLHHGDTTFARFLDLINHRFLLLFYRAWAQAQPVTNLDRRDDDRLPSMWVRCSAAVCKPHSSATRSKTKSSCIMPARWRGRCAMPMACKRCCRITSGCRYASGVCGALDAVAG